MAKLAFIGDSHLGYRHRFKTQRLRDYVASFEDAVDKALSHGPDVVVFAGDIFHHPKPDPVSLRVAVKNLLRCAQKTEVVVLIGNHEIEGHLGTAYPPIYSDIHPKISVLTSENPLKRLNIDGVDFGFYGFEYIRDRQRAQKMLKEISLLPRCDVNILCLHQAVEGYLSPYEISTSTLRTALEYFDLAVLGHVHKHQRLSSVSDVKPAFYVGATERTSFNEHGNSCGFLIFDTDDLSNPSFVGVSSKDMAYVRTKYKGDVAGLNDLLDELVGSHLEPLLKIHVEADLEGDLFDVKSGFDSESRTILEVSVLPKESDSLTASIEKIEVDKFVLDDFFKSHYKDDPALRDVCIEMFTKYGS